MFNFFKRSKKDENKKSKDNKEQKEIKPSIEVLKNNDAFSNKEDTINKKNEMKNCNIDLNSDTSNSNLTIGQCSSNDDTKMCKNNQPSAPELAPENDPIIPLPKNVVNAAKTISSEVATFYEKNIETNNDTKMSDSYLNGLKVPTSNERRGSCVKPCGHGTTAILPRVPIQNTAKKQENGTPPESPVMEIKKNMRYTVNGIVKQKEEKQEEPQKESTFKNDEKEEFDKKLTVAAGKNLEEQIEQEKKNLINQEAKFQSQLNELSKELSARDAEATKLRFQMEELQRDVFAKSAGMDRLQTELNAANKESESIRQKIRYLENELENYRKRNADLSEEIQTKTNTYKSYEIETQSKISELEGVISNLRLRIETLEGQIKALKEEKEELEAKYVELQSERNEERQKLAETLTTATKQKEEIEKKWKEDFEKLRTVNIIKEQELLDDFEWKLREVQQTCKKKLDEKEKLIEARLQDAYKDAEIKMNEAQKMLGQVEALKSYEIEVQQLRNRTSEQEKSLTQMRDQQAQMILAESNLKNETKRLLNLIELEKENLQHIQRIHRQELLDKERKLKDTLNQKRTEIAMYWEEKLLHECSRLKDEMEQIHNEEKYSAMETVRKEKEEEFKKRQEQWEAKMKECLKEIEILKKALDEKDEYYHEELIRVRSNTDKDIMEFRRLMDKIDMTHHENYEKLITRHDEELEKINEEHEKQLKEVEIEWQTKLLDATSNLEQTKEKIEEEAQQKLELLVEQHRNELIAQWDNLVHQKSEAVRLVENEYVSKYKTLEEQFYTQQKSHTSREIELLKTIDALKNEIESKTSTVDDLQNNVETLEGGIQVLNQEIAEQTRDLTKVKNEADQKIRSLHETVAQLLDEREKEREIFRSKYMNSQKQSQETIDHLQRKCNCLTKLFEEVRQRYERRESRQEDLTIISDLRQVISEQEKDLACINEEKRYFQMRLMQLERHFNENSSSIEEEDFEDASESHHQKDEAGTSRPHLLHTNPNNPLPSQNGPIFIPPTIPEGEDE